MNPTEYCARFVKNIVPDRQETRDRQFSSYFTSADSAEHETTKVVRIARSVSVGSASFHQPLGPLHYQGETPACGGETFAEGVETLMPVLPTVQTVSGIGLWRGARRRQGQEEDVSVGTRLEYLLDELKYRGWNRYVPGEAENVLEQTADTLEEELQAADDVMINLSTYRIDPLASDSRAQVYSALSAGYSVSFGTGLLEGFMSLGRNQIALPNVAIGGANDGHAMLMKGVLVGGSPSDGKNLILVQNHWVDPDGDLWSWGGCDWAGPEGQNPLPGFFLMHEDCLPLVWDIHAFK